MSSTQISAPTQTEEGAADSLRARDVGALATLERTVESGRRS
jgi:hypothetical protein